MPLSFFLYLIVVALGWGIASLVNRRAQRPAWDPGVVALVLSALLAGASAVYTFSLIKDAHLTDPGKQGEVFGQVVIGPFLLFGCLSSYLLHRSFRKRKGTPPPLSR